VNCLVDNLRQWMPPGEPSNGLLTGLLQEFFQETSSGQTSPALQGSVSVIDIPADIQSTSEQTSLTPRELAQYYVQPAVNRDRDLLDLAYVMSGRVEVKQFVTEHRLRSLLLDAVEHLDSAFGHNAIKNLQIIQDDDGFENLHCGIVFTGSATDARGSLRKFDADWWLQHCQQSAGKLVFDFELA
jgi:hypothetical protein